MGGRTVKFALEARNESGHPAYWVDGRQRLATCTSVRWIDERRFACASLVGQALYLVEIDAQGGHRVIDRASTIRGDAAVCTDLLDFDGKDLLATSNCEDSSVSFYRLDGDRLRYESSLRIGGEHRGFCHGVAFAPGSDLICVAIQSGAESLQLWSRTTQTCIAVYSRTAKRQDGPAAHRSKLALIEFSEGFRTHRTVSEYFPDASHIDCVAHSSGDVFVTDQGRSQVHRFRIDGELRQLESLDGYDFPHGVDYDRVRGRLAVSNYGSNSVELRAVAAGSP
jgi:hypothetical protein